MIEASIRGVGFWAPGVPDWTLARTLITDAAPWPDATGARPAPAIMPANERRRAPDSVLLALTTADQACAQAGADRASLTSVFASAYGDLAINDYMCMTLADDPSVLSPTKFHNSVHNAPSGYWSIATGAMSPTIAIAGYRESFAAGLLETASQMRESGQPVLLVAYDVAAVGPMAGVARCSAPFACALLLDPSAHDDGQTRLRIDASSDRRPPAIAHDPGLAALAALNPIAFAASALLEALALGAGRQIDLPLTPALRLRVEVCP